MIGKVIHKIDIHSLIRNPDDKDFKVIVTRILWFRTIRLPMINSDRENLIDGIIQVDDNANNSTGSGMLV